tara:strand:+ start:188 stop:934 length:747 start_codon:yes stop_codon:yes gene_type:complete
LDIINSVIKLLTIIPNITGTVTTKNILIAIFNIEISFKILTPKKSAELKMIKGTVRIQSKLTTAVKVTDKATSPSANLVNIFDVTPPGAAAIIITPKAISTGIVRMLIKIKATIGRRMTCDKKPIIKSLGFLITLVKSPIFKPSPNPNIIMAKQIGAMLFAISKYSPNDKKVNIYLRFIIIKKPKMKQSRVVLSSTNGRFSYMRILASRIKNAKELNYDKLKTSLIRPKKNLQSDFYYLFKKKSPIKK